MSASPHPFRVLLRVRYGECDAQGIVFNARYAEYLDLLMSELVRAAFGSYRAMLDEKVDSHVVRCLIEWTAPARFDDVLALSVTRLTFGNTSFTAEVDIRRLADDLAVARAEHVNVMVATQHGGKTPIPTSIRERLAAAAASGGTVDFSGNLGGRTAESASIHHRFNATTEKP